MLLHVPAKVNTHQFVMLYKVHFFCKAEGKVYSAESHSPAEQSALL